jgi:NAD(P)-dependent dehydrogenase (short-subunit alcohol dehydrogenase family)
VPVKEFVEVDLRDKASIDAGAAAIGGPVDALFCCAGLPGAPFSDVDVMKVNYVGTRHFIEQMLPHMADHSAIAWVASNAGLGWQMNMENLLPLVDSDGFEAGVAWCEAHGDLIGNGMSYPVSKQAINLHVAKNAGGLAARNIRFNCSNPGPTATPMMPAFETNNGKGVIAAALGPIERYSTAEEQAWPLIFLNSPRSSYVTGEAFMVDGGFFGAMQTGQIDQTKLLSALMEHQAAQAAG